MDRTILVVDDDAAVVTVIKCMLMELGYRVMTARDAAGAVAVFREHHDIIDLVILDMMMPRVGGSQTWMRLNEIEPGIRTLMCSGSFAYEEIREILSLRSVDFLRKPFEISELSAKVRSLLRAD